MSRRMDQENAELKQLYRDVKKSTKKNSERGLRKLRGEGRTVSRDYLASMGIGALARPAAALAGGKLSRALGNRDIRKAIAKTKNRSAKKMLGKTIKRGPTISRAELAGHGVQGAVMGSVVQMLRDRFSGSAGRGDVR